MIRIACLRGLARLSGDGEGMERLAGERKSLRTLFIQVWRARNRIGGLSDSLRRLSAD